MKTKEYYLMFNGGCRQIMLDEKGNIDEFPHDLDNAILCKQPGKHPHKAVNLHSEKIKER